MKMGRRLRCSSVTYQFRYVPSLRRSIRKRQSWVSGSTEPFAYYAFCALCVSFLSPRRSQRLPMISHNSRGPR
jgi:hypothetical protein